MKLSRAEYKTLYESLMPPSPTGRDLPKAFAVGGAICALGQGLKALYLSLGLTEQSAGAGVSITLIGAGALLTGLGLFEKLAKQAGAGTLIPITGFSNAITAPAMEFRAEGLIPGTCVKMFSIAGPVLSLGLGASLVYGLCLWAMEAGL